MSDADRDPWTEHSMWQIVRADADLEHVFRPLSRIVFKPDTEAGVPGFRMVQVSPPPGGDSFHDTFLVRAGTRPPILQQIDMAPLPVFNSGNAQRYADISTSLAKHLHGNRDLQRLEGRVTIPCHAHSSHQASDHPPLRVTTWIHVYQFDRAVSGRDPLLLVWAPLSPTCPLNGNGTVIGLS